MKVYRLGNFQIAYEPLVVTTIKRETGAVKLPKSNKTPYRNNTTLCGNKWTIDELRKRFCENFQKMPKSLHIMSTIVYYICILFILKNPYIKNNRGKELT